VTICYDWKDTAAIIGHELCATPVCSVHSLVQHNRLGSQKMKIVLQCGLGLHCLHEHFRQRAFKRFGLDIEIGKRSG
jgi:hypothetical protein